VATEHKTMRSSNNGFTILEVALVVLIVAILATLLIPNYQPLLARAQEAACLGNMRSIRNALDSYLNDHQQVWPQGPPPNEAGWAPFWLKTLEPYGIGLKTWQCPTIRGHLKQEELDAMPLHYVPTMFDASPGVAKRWTTQPWLIEIADAHGQGPLICFPDGSVKSSQRVLLDQGFR
jgi:prepilin-type N-terminal cleavage/methylation domain-containing protein